MLFDTHRTGELDSGAHDGQEEPRTNLKSLVQYTPGEVSLVQCTPGEASLFQYTPGLILFSTESAISMSNPPMKCERVV